MRSKYDLLRLRHWLKRTYYAKKMQSGGWGVILIYHRITSPDIDPLMLCVTPDHFHEHLAILRRDYHPTSLTKMTEGINQGAVPPWSVAITFDDGYADNHLCAAPIMEKFGLQGTVFVTGQTLEGKEFFYDELDDIIFRTRILPPVLKFPSYGKEWALGGWSTLPESCEPTFWNWNIGRKDDPTPRHAAYRGIFTWLRGAPASVRDEVMTQLKRMAEPGLFKPDRPRGMSAREIWEACDQNILEIGSHTLTHPVLSELDPKQQWEEISGGKRVLEDILKRPVRSFAYPYGSSWDVSKGTTQLAEKAGFHVSCANMEGTVHTKSSPHWLPRFLVRDWSGEEFATRLQNFFTPKQVRPPLGRL